MLISVDLDGHPHGPFEAGDAAALYRDLVRSPSSYADYIFPAWTFYECGLEHGLPTDSILIPDWVADGVCWPFFGREPIAFTRDQFRAIREELGLPKPTRGSTNLQRDENGEPIRLSPGKT